MLVGDGLLESLRARVNTDLRRDSVARQGGFQGSGFAGVFRESMLACL